jgi:WD40 repeat protein
MQSSSLFLILIAERTADFAGRGRAFEMIDSWLGHDSPRYFLITGKPGSGKSALAARLAQMSMGRQAPGRHERLRADFLSYFHFCQARKDTTLSPSHFLEALAGRLSKLHPPYEQALFKELAPNVNINSKVTVGVAGAGARVSGVEIGALYGGNESSRLKFDRLIRRPLQSLYASGFDGRIVILVDALDESRSYDARDNLATLLREVAESDDADLPAQVRFILTSRDVSDFAHAGGDSSLDLTGDTPENVEDVRAYSYARLSNLDEPLRSSLSQRVAVAGAGNFLYARYVINDLLSRPRGGEDPGTAELPKDLDDVYRGFLKQTLAQQKKDWNERYRPLLGILAVAHGPGLSARHLAGIAGLTQSKTDDILEECAQYLTGPGPDGAYSIYHHSFRQFLSRDDVYNVYPAEAHASIAHYFLGLHGHDWLACGDAYALAYTPTHLREAARLEVQPLPRRGHVERLFGLLTDFPFAEAKVGRFGVDALLSDLRAARAAGPEEAEASSRADALRRVLDREAHNLRGWEPSRRPAFFAQQLRNWAADTGLDFLASAPGERLARLGQPYLSLAWRAARESQELERILSGHESSVVAVAVSEDARVASSIDDYNRFRVWEPETGQTLRAFQGHKAPIRAAALSQDGRYALTAPWDAKYSLEIWDVWEGVLMHRVSRGGEGLRALAVSPDGHRGVAVYVDDQIVLWDIASGHRSPPFTIGEYYDAEPLAFTPDGRHVLCANTFLDLKLWDVETKKKVREFGGHQGSVEVITFDRRGTLAAAATTYGFIYVWEVSTGKMLRELRAIDVHQNAIRALAFTPDGLCIVSGSADSNLVIWDIESGKPGCTLYGHAGRVNSVAVTSDGHYILSGSGDRTVRVWSIQSLRPQHRRVGHLEGVSHVRIGAGGSLGVSASEDGTVKVWNLRTGDLVHDLTGHEGKVNDVAVAPDGLSLVSASDDATLRLWDTKSGACLRTLTGHTDKVYAVVFTRDGSRFVSGSEDTTVRVWSTDADEPLHVFEGHFRSVLALALSADERYVASASADAMVRLWDLSEGRAAQLGGPGHGSWVRDVTFTSDGDDGEYVVSASDDRTLGVCRLVPRTRMYTLAGHENYVLVVTAVPGSPHVVSASEDSTLKVWYAPGGVLVHDLTGHTGTVFDVAVSEDGRLAASASQDRTLRVWDLRAGRELAVTALDGSVQSVAFSGNDTLLVGDWGGNVYCFRYVAPAATDFKES